MVVSNLLSKCALSLAASAPIEQSLHSVNRSVDLHDPPILVWQSSLSLWISMFFVFFATVTSEIIMMSSE